jgi:hypothetical protein
MLDFHLPEAKCLRTESNKKRSAFYSSSSIFNVSGNKKFTLPDE